LRLLILVAREEFLKDKCGPRTKKFEHHCVTLSSKRLRQFAKPCNFGGICASFLISAPLYFTRTSEAILSHQWWMECVLFSCRKNRRYYHSFSF